MKLNYVLVRTDPIFFGPKKFRNFFFFIFSAKSENGTSLGWFRSKVQIWMTREIWPKIFFTGGRNKNARRWWFFIGRRFCRVRLRFETILVVYVVVLSNAKLLYTSSKNYKEAGVVFCWCCCCCWCCVLVGLRRRRLFKVVVVVVSRCKNTACIEKNVS